MLDINLFRKERGGDPEVVKDSQRRRYVNRDDCEEKVALVDKVIELDAQHREALYKAEGHRRDINRLSKEVGVKKRNKENADELTAQVKAIKEELAAHGEELQRLAAAVSDALVPIGNLVHASVPVSDDEVNNAVVKEHGAFTKEAHHRHNHVELAQLLDIVDLDNGTIVAGGRGYYLKGAGVLLNQALINCALQHAVRDGATPIQTPFFMRKSIMAECAQLKEFDEALYHVTGEGEDKYLIATSEQPLCALHRQQWFEAKQLPTKYVGLSTCFRKEAGSHGRDTLGIFRVHQFEKVEQFSVTSDEDDASWRMLDEMLATSESFYQALGLPYRVVNIVSGELNDAAAKKYDLEAWFPGGTQPTHRELVSCSNCTDYQSRNLEVRLRAPRVAGEERKAYVHMLNSTLTATERTLCCVLENYQTEEGVRVPEALQPFMMGTTFLPFKKAFDKKGKPVARPSPAPADSADMNTT